MARGKTQLETKSKRLNLLIKPSTYDSLDKIAYARRESVNGIINGLIEKYIEENESDVSRYNTCFDDSKGAMINEQ